MKRIKKFVAIISALAILLCTPAFAASPAMTDELEFQAQIQENVQTMVQARLDEVEYLFEGKAPGYLEVYTEYLTAYYTQLVLAENGIMPAKTRYRLDNGGAAMYTTVDAAGDYFDVVVLLLDKDDAYDYLLDNWSGDGADLGDIFLGVLGYVPAAGTIFSTIANLLTGAKVIMPSTWESIQAADGRILVETVRARGYPGELVTTPVRGWDTYPYFEPWDSLPSDIEIEVVEFD